MANEERKASQSSIGYTRTIEKAFEDSEYCGKLDLSGHKLSALPEFAGNYELDNLIFIGMIVWLIDYFIFIFIFFFFFYCLFYGHTAWNKDLLIYWLIDCTECEIWSVWMIY